MFPWSAMFSLEPKVPGQRSPEEVVTNTPMLELGVMVKRTWRICLERSSKVRRCRSSASSPDYSWLAGLQPHVPYQLTPRDVLDLQNLCGQIPPSQCGPVIVRFRNLVSQLELEVHEVPQLFRSVLRACLNKEQTDEELQGRTKRRSDAVKAFRLLPYNPSFVYLVVGWGLSVAHAATCKRKTHGQGRKKQQLQSRGHQQNLNRRKGGATACQK